MPAISLLADLPRGDPARQERQYAAPAAQFLDPAQLRRDEFAYTDKPQKRSGLGALFRSGAPQAKLFLGVIDGTVEGNGRHRFVTGGRTVGYMDDRHMVTIAGSRAGKGRAAIVPNMLGYPGSVLALDPKGELATLTARHRAEELGQKVYVLDPFGTVKGAAADYRAGFNPVAAMRSDSLVEDAALIVDAIVQVAEKDPHWDESARSLIEGVALHVATFPHYEKRRSLVTLYELIGEGELDPDGVRTMQALSFMMKGNEAAGGAVRRAAADFFDKPQGERGSVLSTARRHIRFLGYPGVQAVVGRHDFDLEVLKREAATVYLCLPARHMGTCARWLRLFVNLTLQAMERLPGKPSTGLPVLMALDEFAVLGHLRQVEEAAGQIAGFGVKLWPILQDLGQLKALYKDRWETFLGNAGVLQFFGNNDLTTLEWISRRCGRTTIRVRNDIARTDSQTQAGAPSESWGSEVHDLLTIDEAARLFARDDSLLRQLVIIGGGRPAVLQRAYYDKHERFLGFADG